MPSRAWIDAFSSLSSFSAYAEICRAACVRMCTGGSFLLSDASSQPQPGQQLHGSGCQYSRSHASLPSSVYFISVLIASLSAHNRSLRSLSHVNFLAPDAGRWKS
eukprot:6203752-Pleurochrysis_carterae.AAC.2